MAEHFYNLPATSTKLGHQTSDLMNNDETAASQDLFSSHQGKLESLTMVSP